MRGWLHARMRAGQRMSRVLPLARIRSPPLSLAPNRIIWHKTILDDSETILDNSETINAQGWNLRG